MSSEDPRTGLEDFRNFLLLCWRHLGLPDPTPIQYDFAYFLQYGPDPGKSPNEVPNMRLLGEMFRGAGKSWVTSAFACWALLWNPDLAIMVVSASKQRADDFSTFTMRLITELPELRHLTPREEQRNSKIAFDVAPARAKHAPSVKSVGITGQMTGSRADLIIADDVESLNNSATQTMRDRLALLIKEFDAILSPGGRIIFLGTPQTEDSIYRLLPERGYHTRIWPARYPNSKQLVAYGEMLAPMIVRRMEGDPDLEGDPTDPKRFDEFDLQGREASYGRSGFALQFMLDTRLSDADRYPLKLADLVVMDLDADVAPQKVVWASSPELALNDVPVVGFRGDRYYRPMACEGQHVAYTGSVLAIDPAGRGKDETAIAVVNMLNGQLFALEVAGLSGGYEEATLRQIVREAKRFHVNEIVVESNFGDGMFVQLLTPYLRREYPCTVTEVRHNVQKERRIIDTLEPVMNQHKLVVNKAIIRDDALRTQDLPNEQALKYQLFYQLTRITRDRGALRHDDRIDVLSMAVAYWVEQMARDTDEAKDAQDADALDRELRRFEAACLGKKPTEPNWMDGSAHMS